MAAPVLGAGAREALKEAIDVFEGMNDDEIDVELLPRLRAALADTVTETGGLSQNVGKPVAWVYELATTRDSETGEYGGWVRRLTWTEANVPAGSIRDMQPLYALPSPVTETGGRGEGPFTVSDEDWRRALDCAHSCFPLGKVTRQELDNAMQHAFGMLSLSALPRSLERGVG